MSDTVIECHHLTHRYGKRLIYDDLNFEVKQGKILGLLGKNGTGKTTTINILMGYLRPPAERAAYTARTCSTSARPRGGA